MIEQLKDHLRDAEGWMREPYNDKTGNILRLTDGGHVSIGCGRNTEANPLSDAAIEFLLFEDITRVIQQCNTLPYWNDLDAVRQLCVADVVFNIGFAGWKGFRLANRALMQHDYDMAAFEMENSRWHGQVYRRARKLVAAMRTGVWE
jgi:lysozyme